MDIAGRKITPAFLVGTGMLAAALIGFCGINPYLPGGGDNAGYIAEAEALISLGHRANLYDPAQQFVGFKPPLFPLLLAGVELIFGRSIVAMKALLVLFSAASVWAAWWALRAGLQNEDTSPEESEKQSLSAAAIAFWFALTPTLSLYTHDVLSDVPFTFFALLAAGFAFRAARSRHIIANASGLAITLAIATLLRTAGVILGGACCAALLAEALAQRRNPSWRGLTLHAMAAGLIAIAFLAWQASSGHSYVAFSGVSAVSPAHLYSAESIAARILRVGLFYLCFLPSEIAAYPGLSPVGAVYAMVVLMLFVLTAGTISLWRSGRHMIPALWFSHQCALLFWPFIDARFFLPTLPLFLCLVWYGVREIFERLKSASPIASLAAIYVAALFPAVSVFGTVFFFGIESIESSTFVEWGAAVVLVALVFAWTLKSKSNGKTGLLPGVEKCGIVAAFIFLALVSLRGVSENIVRERNRGPEPPGVGWAEFHRASMWLKDHAAPQDIVVSAKPPLLWFWSGLHGISIPGIEIVSDANSRIAVAQWLVFDGLAEDGAAERYLKPVVSAHSGDWELKWAQGTTAVLRRKNSESK